MKQEFRFSPDKTVDLTLRFAVDAALLALASKDSDPFFCPTQAVAKSRDGVSGKAVRTTEGGDVVCTLTLSGPIDRVFEEITEMSGEDKLHHSIRILDDDQTYELVVEQPSYNRPNGAQSDPMTDTINAMLVTKMSGRVLSWTVVAPRVIETNGTVSEESTKATFSRPVADAFVSTEPTKFRVVFSLDKPGLWGGFLRMFQ